MAISGNYILTGQARIGPLCIYTDLGEAATRQADGKCWTVHNQWNDSENYWTVSIWYRHRCGHRNNVMHYELRWEPCSNVFAEDDIVIIQGKEFAEALPRWLCMA